MGAPSGATQSSAPGASSTGKRRLGPWAIAGIVVLALIVVAGVIGSIPTGSSAGAPSTKTDVQISSLQWAFSGSAACWNSTATPGLNVPGGLVFNVSIALSYNAAASGPTSCVVTDVASTTSGFQEISADTPLSVPSGSTEILNVELRAPNVNESTALSLDAVVATSSSGSRVNITAVNWGFSGASNCWTTATTPGLAVAGGAQFTVSIRLNYTAGLLEPSTCTVKSVAVSTSGFSLVSAIVPLVVSSGGSATLSVTLRAPSADQTEALTLDCQTSSP